MRSGSLLRGVRTIIRQAEDIRGIVSGEPSQVRSPGEIESCYPPAPAVGEGDVFLSFHRVYDRRAVPARGCAEAPELPAVFGIEDEHFLVGRSGDHQSGCGAGYPAHHGKPCAYVPHDLLFFHIEGSDVAVCGIGYGHGSTTPVEEPGFELLLDHLVAVAVFDADDLFPDDLGAIVAL